MKSNNNIDEKQTKIFQLQDSSIKEKEDKIIIFLRRREAHIKSSILSGKTVDSIKERLTKLVEINDINSLKRLHEALTKNIWISHYAAWSPDEVQHALEMTEAAFLKLGKKAPKKQKENRKPRSRDKKQVKVLDLSCFEQSDLFVDQSRWPRRPYYSNNFDWTRICSLQQALLHRYISANPPHLWAWLIFDIDLPDAATAWERAELPPPTWTAVNKQNGHAHSVWGLRTPVLMQGIGVHDAPIRFLTSIESMMREKLKADDSFAGLLTKNPAHLDWEIIRGPQMFYDLNELSAHLPGIEKHRPNKSAKKIGFGRNVTLFDELGKWSFKEIRKFYGGRINGWNNWLSACINQGLRMNADLFGMNTLDYKEVLRIAKSVAKWSWHKMSPTGFSEWQSAQGKKGAIASAKVRSAASEDKRASARLMRTNGMSFRTIAKELDVSIGSAHAWCA